MVNYVSTLYGLLSVIVLIVVCYVVYKVYTYLSNCTEKNGGIMGCFVRSSVDGLKAGANAAGTAITYEATQNNWGGPLDNSGGVRTTAKFEIYEDMIVKDVYGNPVTISVKNDSIAGGVTDLKVTNYCNNFSKNRKGNSIIDPSNIQDETFTNEDMIALNTYTRYYGESPYIDQEDSNGDRALYAYSAIQMANNDFDHNQTRTFQLYTGGQIDLHSSVKLDTAFVGLAAVAVIAAGVAATIYTGGMAAPALFSAAAGMIALAGAAAGTGTAYAYAKIDSISRQGNVNLGQTTDPDLFKSNGVYPVKGDIGVLSAVSTQILTNEDIRSGVRSVLYKGQGLVVRRKTNDNMHYPTDLLLLYRVKHITYKRLVGGKGLFNLDYNVTTPVILLYKPLVEENGNILFNARIRFIPSSDPTTGKWQYVTDFLNELGVTDYTYNLVFNGAQDGWIANESLRAVLHALCLLKDNPEEGIFTTDSVYQEWLACNAFNEKLYSREMAISGYNLPTRKRFRINACKQNMPVAINPDGNGSNLGGLLSSNPVNLICGDNSFISSPTAKSNLCNSITYDGKGKEGTSMFYYPGADNGGRNKSNCYQGAGGSYRYALAMDRLPSVCNAYGFAPKLTYFSFSHMFLNDGKAPTFNYMTSGSYYGNVALSRSDITDFAYLNFSVLFPGGSFSDVYSLNDIQNVMTQSNGTLIVRIELNDKLLTGNLSDTSRPLFMSEDNTPPNTANGLHNDTDDNGDVPLDGLNDIHIDDSSKIIPDYTQLWYLTNCTVDNTGNLLQFKLFNAENGLQVCCVVNKGYNFYFVSGVYSTNTVDTTSSFVNFILNDTRSKNPPSLYISTGSLKGIVDTVINGSDVTQYTAISYPSYPKPVNNKCSNGFFYNPTAKNCVSCNSTTAGYIPATNKCVYCNDQTTYWDSGSQQCLPKPTCPPGQVFNERYDIGKPIGCIVDDNMFYAG